MSNEVAQTILQQLGGNKFIAMTGAKRFVAHEDGLSFSLGRNASNANYVKITLNGKDLYDVKFERVTTNKTTFEMKRVVKAEEKDLYCDMLQSTFTEITGLYTSL